jgi:hypothetical protein
MLVLIHDAAYNGAVYGVTSAEPDYSEIDNMFTSAFSELGKSG